MTLPRDTHSQVGGARAAAAAMLRIGVGVYATGSRTGHRRGAAGAGAFVTTLVGRALVAAAPAVEHIGEREYAVVGPAQDHPWSANTDAVLARLIRRTE